MKKVKTLCLLFITIISLQFLSSCEFIKNVNSNTISDILTYNNFEYTVDDDKAIITRYIGNDDNVVIPSFIERNDKSYDVIEIGEGTFSECGSITSITIPSSVTSIGYYPFYGCDSLTNVYYEGTIEDWCNITFDGWGSNPMSEASHFYMLNENNNYKEVTSIEIPSTITSIGSYQFCGFNNVISIIISSSVASIGEYAFSGCSSLTTVTFEDNSKLESIASDAFSKCGSLTSITIPSSVTSIGGSAFKSCTSLTSITIPSSVNSIGEDAFLECNSLQYNKYDNGLYLGNEENPYLVLAKC